MKLQPGKKQFTNEITIKAPIHKVWEVIDDSKQMEIWGPPVQQVDLIGNEQGNEQVGSIRKVHAVFGSKQGTLTERRTVCHPNKRLDYQIFEETFGLFKMLKHVGFSIEISPISPITTKLSFSFYQTPKGLGYLMHPFIKKQQNRNNLEGISSLKQYIEDKIT